jgi:hypothetical protein
MLYVPEIYQEQTNLQHKQDKRRLGGISAGERSQSAERRWSFYGPGTSELPSHETPDHL